MSVLSRRVEVSPQVALEWIPSTWETHRVQDCDTAAKTDEPAKTGTVLIHDETSSGAAETGLVYKLVRIFQGYFWISIAGFSLAAGFLVFYTLLFIKLYFIHHSQKSEGAKLLFNEFEKDQLDH